LRLPIAHRDRHVWPTHASTKVDAAITAIDQADLLIVVGSTLIVQPANELPCVAIRNGTPIVMINFDATQYDSYAKGLIRKKAGEFLGAVAEKLNEQPDSLRPATSLRKLPAAVRKTQNPEELKHARLAQEASRCGKEIFANAKACGMAFFCTAVAEPQGDIGLLERSLAIVDAESAGIGKMLFSDGCDQLVVVASIPDALVEVLDCNEWLQAVKRVIGGNIESTPTLGNLIVPAGADAYPIKLKEPGITAAIGLLKTKSLFPEVGDEDELIFGDDDFPM